MAIAIGSCWNGTVTGGTTISPTAPTTPTTSSGSLLILATWENTNGTATWTVADSSGTNVWTQTASGYSTESSTSERMDIRYVYAAAPITSLTVTFNGSVTGRVVLCEVTGAATASPEDISVNIGGSGFITSLTSGTFTTTNANDLLVYVVGTLANAAAFTAGANYAIPANATSTAGSVTLALQGRVVSATQAAQTTSMSWTNSARAASVFAAFKAALADGTINNMGQGIYNPGVLALGNPGITNP